MTNDSNSTSPVKADRFSNRAPIGGAVSPVNGRFYRGGQFMQTVAEVAEVKPAVLEGSSRQVAWASRLRREALARLEDEIGVRRLILSDPHGADTRAARRGVEKLLFSRHALMVERSAAAVIENRMAFA